MAVYHPYTVRCACGNILTVQLADSVNVRRFPRIRDEILAGRMHQSACPRCGSRMTVEKPFYYTDLTRRSMYKVLPRGERHNWEAASKDLSRASSLLPSSMHADDMNLRVVFGLDALREKLVAEDVGLDDRVLELLKVLLIYEHPVLLRRARLRLHLTEVTDIALRFVAEYEHDARRFVLEMPRGLAERIAEAPAVLADWTQRAHRTSLFEIPDHWVNIWRWSPQPGALAKLAEYAAAARAGEDIDTDSAAFKGMIGALPRGAHLPPWAKKDLRTLFEYSRERNLQALQDSLFEVRFGFELEDDWSTNSDLDDIDTLWKLLKDLPDTNVEGNTKIREIALDVGEGGGYYSPTANDIHIGSDELVARERFEDVVRHEVGHAVHEQRPELVNRWLADRFGWKILGTSDQEIDEWVELMGGWGDLTSPQRREVRDALRTCIGYGSSWVPTPLPAIPLGHPWYRDGFGPRLAYEQTGSAWYRNYASWHRADGRAFFLNYWYATLMSVDEATLDLVALMPDPYASMSHYEFFAELYALFYDLDDPKRDVIPADIAEWLEENVGSPEIAAPRPAAPRPARAWESIKRP